MAFNEQLEYPAKLPKHQRIINPFVGEHSDQVKAFCSAFYEKYYSDSNPRVLVLGINPGRHGAGSTGIPFTDTKRLEEFCDIPSPGMHTHEPSSVFVYEVINALGGPAQFYRHVLINSLCPLGFLTLNPRGNWINYNFYDDKALTEKTIPFIRQNLHFLKALTGNIDECILLGQGKNYQFFKKLNDKEHFFRSIIPLAHPRYIMQYKLKEKDKFLEEYMTALKPYVPGIK